MSQFVQYDTEIQMQSAATPKILKKKNCTKPLVHASKCSIVCFLLMRIIVKLADLTVPLDKFYLD